MKTVFVLALLVSLMSFGSMMSVISTSIQTNQNNPVKIATTMNFLADFAEGLLKSNGEINSIVDANQDPHFFEPTAGDLIVLENADIILAIGHEEIDGWLVDFLTDNSQLSDKVFFVVDLSSVIEFDPLINANNPHFWLSVNNSMTMVSNIADHFINNLSIEANIIENNRDVYLNQLISVYTELLRVKTNLNQAKVVVDHPAFFYLLKDLELDRIGVLEEKEGVDPSPLHVQDLAEKMKRENVDLIIASKTQAGTDVQELARTSGAKIAYLTPLGGISDAENYVEMMFFNLNSLQNPVDPPKEDDLTLGFNIFISSLFLTVISYRFIVKRKMKK